MYYVLLQRYKLHIVIYISIITNYYLRYLLYSICILLEICEYGSLADVVKGRIENGTVIHRSLTLSISDILYLGLGCAR